MTTDAEKLARIATLTEQWQDGCDEWDAIHPDDPHGDSIHQLLDEVRAILAEPGPAVPPQDINHRDHVAEAIRLARQRWVGGPDYEFDLALADAVLALVQPVEGVILTPEERAKLAYLVEHASYSSTLDIFVIEWFEEHGSALAARLEKD